MTIIDCDAEALTTALMNCEQFLSSRYRVSAAVQLIDGLALIYNRSPRGWGLIVSNDGGATFTPLLTAPLTQQVAAVDVLSALRRLLEEAVARSATPVPDAARRAEALVCDWRDGWIDPDWRLLKRTHHA